MGPKGHLSAESATPLRTCRLGFYACIWTGTGQSTLKLLKATGCDVIYFGPKVPILKALSGQSRLGLSGSGQSRSGQSRPYSIGTRILSSHSARACIVYRSLERASMFERPVLFLGFVLRTAKLPNHFLLKITPQP